MVTNPCPPLSSLSPLVRPAVHPDPPIRLNWTLLSVSRSGLHFDIIAHWEPPPSADVRAGWMTLVYEVHYRERNASQWNTVLKQTPSLSGTTPSECNPESSPNP